MTTLTVYGTTIAATTISTANKLTTTLGTATNTWKSTKTGTSSGWSEVWSRQNGTWSALGSIGSPTGHGFLLDETTLENKRFSTGNWSGSARFHCSLAALTATVVVRAYRYSNDGTYTSIGLWTVTGQNIPVYPSILTVDLAPTSFSTIDFGTGDKIYIDCWFNITSPSSDTSNFVDIIETDTTIGDSSVFYVTTSSYSSLPVILTPTPATFSATTSQPELLAVQALTPTPVTFSATTSQPSLTVYYPSPQSQYIIKQQLVKVYTPLGVFIDVWRDAPLLDGVKEAVNSATTPIRVKLPRAFDHFDEANTVGSRGTIAQGNIVQYYLFGPGLSTSGVLRYQGIIDAYEPAIEESGEESVTVTITPLSCAVGDRALIGALPFTVQDPVSMFRYWFTNYDPVTGIVYTTPLTLDPSNPSTSGSRAQFTFANQQLYDIFNTILRLLPPKWFWRVNVDGSVTLNQAPTTPQHTFIIGRHCSAIQYAEDWTQLKNNVYVTGADGITGHAIGTSIATFGNRVMIVSESRITDTNTAYQYACALLAVYDTKMYRATVKVFDYRGDAQFGLGYDIESIKVGDTCRVIVPQSTYDPVYASISSTWGEGYWGTMYWNYGPGGILGQTVMIASVSYHFDYVELELADLRPSQDVALARIQSRLENNN